ncbi:Vacuolar H+-ATPase V1 sector, subunit E, partial [Trachipleistophora hominis]
VKKRLMGVHLNQQLINQTMEVVRDEKDVVVYVLARDRNRVNVRGEIRELESDRLGGIIVMSKDGTVLVDNSYLTRLEKVRIQHMPTVSKELFRSRK